MQMEDKKPSKRKSGESGYVSDIVSVSPLKGPESLENSDLDQANEGSLSLDLGSCLETPNYNSTSSN